MKKTIPEIRRVYKRTPTAIFSMPVEEEEKRKIKTEGGRYCIINPKQDYDSD